MDPTTMTDANVSNIYSQYTDEYPSAECMHSQISVLA